jgi:hypothetical protein
MFKNLTIHKIATSKLALFIGFLGFSLFGILRHEMWRDELQAWLLARDSSSLYELYQNIQYEGHPALWHLFLFGLNRVTSDPLIMQLFHWLLSLVIVYLIVYFSPFSLFQRFSFCFGYFIFFEYTLISRNYNLAVLFAFLFCVLYAYSSRRYISYALLLALLANTSAYGLILSLALFLYLCLNEFPVCAWPRKQTCRKRLSFRGQINFLSGLIIIILGWFSSAFQIMRIRAINFADFFSSGTTSYELVTAKASFIHLSALGVPSIEQIIHASRALNGVWESYCPVPALFTINFWDTNILTYGDFLGTISGVDLNDILTVLFSISLLLLFGFVFLPNQSVFWTYVIGNFLLLGLHVFLFRGFVIRHEGFFLILLVLCCWLFLNSTSRKYSQRNRISRVNFLSVMLSLIFTTQLIGGVYSVGMDYIHPFSAGKDAASFIKDNDLADLPIFGSRYRQASVLSGYLDTMIYYPELQRFGSFWKREASEMQDEQQLLREIQSFISRSSSYRAVAALTQPIHESNIHNSIEFANLEIDFLEGFDKAIVDSEAFFLYLVKGK